MPLASSYDAPTGDSYPAAYSVVVEAVVDFRQHTMRATVNTYRDADAFAAGRAPVSTRSFGWGADDVGGDVGAGILRGLVDLETALLDRPEFAGATLVDEPVGAAPPPDQTRAVAGVAVETGPPPSTGVVVTLEEPT